MKNKTHNSLFVIRHSHLPDGFSLIEILVVIGIFVTLSSLIFFNFRTFSSRIVVDNLAHEIALTIRQAQIFGIGVRGSAGEFPSYGTYFSLANNKSFTFFADTDPPGNPAGDGKYTGADSLIQELAIRGTSFISQICGYASPISSCTSLDEVHVSYIRPNPEGTIIGIASGIGESEYSYAKIFVSSGDLEHSREVTVWSNGQISVQ